MDRSWGRRRRDGGGGVSTARWGTLVRPLARAADAVLDPSIVFSFDQTGYLRHRAQFDDADLDIDMTGRVCLVTGGNSGLGLATARGLPVAARRCGSRSQRSPPARVCEELANETAIRTFRTVGSISAIPSPSMIWFGRWRAPVHVLVNNAGVLLDERGEAEGGLELTLATNLVGHLPHRRTVAGAARGAVRGSSGCRPEGCMRSA